MSHTRRAFLRAGLGASTALSLGSIAPPWLVNRALLAGPRSSDRDTILVVIQLSGGNDGLNTVVPYGDDNYARHRTTLRLSTDELHRIDSYLGFHPRMGAFHRLYQEGCLSIVQGVGYSQPDQSHERAMRIWHTADPERPGRQTGWLGRVADELRGPTDKDTRAVFVGPIGRPFLLNAEKTLVPSIRSAEELVLRTMPGTAADTPATLDVPRDGSDAALMRFVRETMRTAHANSRRVVSTAAAADYPNFALARDLRTIARLIRADVGIRIFCTELGGGGIGGFDNHANQLGNHCALLHQLAESAAAFVDDLRRENLLDRVLLMTFSEFGRTVQENGRRGTGHGAAAPVFLAGGGVKGGLVGPHPSLSDLDGGGLRFHLDFRRLYATVLDRWLGFDSSSVLGAPFEPVDVLST